MDLIGVPISCRVSEPYSPVVLRSVSSGEEMLAFYDNKMGFFGNLSPGQYQCETTVNGQIFRSAIYTVKNEGKPRQNAVFELMLSWIVWVCLLSSYMNPYGHSL